MIKEEHDREISVEELLTQNVAALTSAVQILNDVQLVILHNMKELKMPEWESYSDIENEISKTVIDCCNAVRKAYGRGKVDKS